MKDSEILKIKDLYYKMIDECLSEEDRNDPNLNKLKEAIFKAFILPMIISPDLKPVKSLSQPEIKLYGLEEGIIKAKEYKEKISFITCGENNPMFKKGILIKGEKNGMFGKQHNEQTKQKMRKKRSEETKQKIIIAQKLRRQKEKLFKQNINI